MERLIASLNEKKKLLARAKPLTGDKLWLSFSIGVRILFFFNSISKKWITSDSVRRSTFDSFAISIFYIYILN